MVFFHIALVIIPRLISFLGLNLSRADNKGIMKKAMY